MRIKVNGRWIEPRVGCSLAANYLSLGETRFRTSVSGEPRAPLCGMGICFECRVEAEDVPHVRSCQVNWQLPFDASPRRECREFVIVGAGPAGLAAARAIEAGGQRGLILDDNETAGGQIWRGEDRSCGGAEFWPQSRVVAAQPGELRIEQPTGLVDLRFGKLILATGARERWVPFPGWTLPRVMGAGGLQALVKSGLRIAGKRVVVAGTGPLLLAVAAALRKHGARVLLIAEQASTWPMVRFAASAFGKWGEMIRLMNSLRGVPYRWNTWVEAATGQDQLQHVLIRQRGEQRLISCDYLATGYGLVANTELAALLGCETAAGHVVVDSQQQTSVTNIFAAGELTGVGGVEKAEAEGSLAGWAAGGHTAEVARAQALVRRTRRWQHQLNRAFALRDELRALPKADTIVCRCEDVRHHVLRDHREWRAAKLHTRCGMGPCQGRVCGPAVEFLYGWRADSVRPPLLPTRVAALAAEPEP
jgi:NADPH-dependent 2,4-dienoyl-CoA reductase/sulfur reductase-like enzyme